MAAQPVNTPLSWFGQQISNVGTAIHLPEMNISEGWGYTPPGPSIGPESGLAGNTVTNNNNGSLTVNPTTPPGTQPPATQPKVLRTQVTNNAPTNTGGGAPDINAQLDSIFSPIFDALNGQESSVNANYGTQVGDINQQGVTAQSSLDTQQATSGRALDQLGTEAQGTKTDALTAATRLYSELTRGGQQRFGGASSAGEAFGALTAVEQQRRQATIQTAYDTAMQKVAGFKADLVSKFDDAKIQLTSAINSQLASARQQWTDAMTAIGTAKGQAQSDKAQASLNNLNDYRNKVYTINLQGQQAMQTLAANHQVSLSAVDNYTQQMINNLSSGSNAVINMGNTANTAAGSTSLGIGSTASATPTLQTGAINPTKKYDQFGNLIP